MAKRLDRGLYYVDREIVDRIDGTPRDWIDENLEKIEAGARRVLDDEPDSPNGALARDVLAHCRNLQAYRSSYVGRRVRGRRIDSLSPALWEMMCLMLAAGMLDTNFTLGRAVQTYAKTRSNLPNTNGLQVTKEQAVEAIKQHANMQAAADHLGISVRSLRNLVPLTDRQNARKKRSG